MFSTATNCLLPVTQSVYFSSYFFFPQVAPKHNKNLLPNELSTSSTQLKDVCALNSTAGPSPLSSPVKHLLQSTSRKTMTRSQARTTSLPAAKCSQHLLVSGPAMNLRSKKQALKPPVGDSSEYILSTLEAINSPTVSKFLVKLSKLQGRCSIFWNSNASVNCLFYTILYIHFLTMFVFQ